jgi:transposase
MKAYSVDLRQRVADAVLQDHLPWAQVARLFRLSVASVGRFVRARRRGQDLSPRPSSGRPHRLALKRFVVLFGHEIRGYRFFHCCRRVVPKISVR